MWRRLSLCLGICLFVLAACSSPTPTPTPGAPATIVAAKPANSPAPSPSPVALLGGKMPTTDPAIHIFLWGNASTTARDLQLAAGGGFHWVKQRFEWRNLEGKNKGNFEWNEPDRIVDAIQQSGLKIVARVDNQPRWASSSIVWPGSGPPDNPKDWSDFLTALASRYKGRIQAYEIWNEPNLDREWGRRPPNAGEYVQLLKASYDAIKRADSNAIVITAGLSPTTDISENARAELTYF